MLGFWLSTFVLEFLFPQSLNTSWRRRRWLAIGLIAIIGYSSIKLATKLDTGPALLLGFLMLFRVGNQLRVVKSRMHAGYLRRTVQRSVVALFLLHALILLCVLPFVFALTVSLQGLLVLQLVVAATILAIAAKNLHKLRFQMPKVRLTDRELPTVTVAIPARNETTDLEACLQSVLANDYPKLEVIVLDDCSQGQTADIIRSFAHDGVRFVQGAEPAQRWLAKNQAYEKLYEEATGDLMLFCGVDVRFGPQAIRSMVNALLARKKKMLSVMPLRTQDLTKASLIQPMRYWWELALPRRLFNKPPVLSTCWLIERKTLKKLGGFKSVCHTIIPEGVFARELIRTDHYSFIRSSGELEVKTVKTWREQWDTAVRMRYPQIRRRPENALVLTLVQTIFLLLPFVFIFSLHLWVNSPWTVLPFVTSLLLIITHALIVSATNPPGTLLACVDFPLVVLTELLLGYTSMIQYEFFTVSWKDRNICIPVMHVIPKLPDLPRT